MDSSPAVGKTFSFCNSVFFFSRGSHLESANTNEINRDIHLAFTLFWKENSIFLMVLFSFSLHSELVYSDACRAANSKSEVHLSIKRLQISINEKKKRSDSVYVCN